MRVTIRRVTDIIDIGRLERETHPWLYAGFCVAVIVNLLIGALFAHHVSGLTREALTIDDRRSIRVELIPMPRPQQRYIDIARPEIHRRTINRQAMEDDGANVPDVHLDMQYEPEFRGPVDSYRISKAETDSLIDAILTADIPEELKMLLALDPFIIDRIYQELTISRTPWDGGDHISLRDELIHIMDLDTGQYPAVVVLGSEGVRDVRGFVHIPSLVWGRDFEPPSDIRAAISGLSEILKMDTGIVPIIDKQVTIDSLSTKQYPFIYVAADEAFELTPAERDGIRNYLRNGGFIFAEAYGFPAPGAPPRGAPSIRKLFHDALGSELRTIENTHELYHVYYDFDDGPPSLSDNQMLVVDGQPMYFLEGAFIGDRLVGVYSEKQYGAQWADVSELTHPFRRMGVNLLLYAMIRQDSMSLKILDDSGQSP